MDNNKYFIQDYSIVKENELITIPPDVPIVYEVLRVIDYVPLFFDGHFDRMQNSCYAIGQNLKFNKDKLFRLMKQLAIKSGIINGNIYINLAFVNDKQQLQAYFIPHIYPSDTDYQKGVVLGFLEAERNNPEAKVIQPLRELANNEISKSGVYEVILVNKNMHITEGSRSNLFLIKNNELFTAPLHNVLKGITLCKVIELASELKINVNYGLVGINELGKFDSMFLTGTSPKILPVSKAGKYHFNIKNELLRRLMQKYDTLIDEDIRMRK
jgi:branched-chain amino acid aminotransferase